MDGPYYQQVKVFYFFRDPRFYGNQSTSGTEYYWVQYIDPASALEDNSRQEPSWLTPLAQKTIRDHQNVVIFDVRKGGVEGYLVTSIPGQPDYVSEVDIQEEARIIAELNAPIPTGAITRSQAAAAIAAEQQVVVVRYVDPLDDGRPWYAPVKVGYMTEGYPRTPNDTYASYDHYLVQYKSRLAGMEDSYVKHPSWTAALTEQTRAKHPNATEAWSAGKDGYLRQHLWPGEVVDYVSEFSPEEEV